MNEREAYVFCKVLAAAGVGECVRLLHGRVRPMEEGQGKEGGVEGSGEKNDIASLCQPV